MEIQERIIDGAGQLFYKYGIRSVSMDDIASHLGISKKTIYQYYKDKEDLVLKALERHLSELQCEYEQIFDSTHCAVEELSLVSSCLCRNIQDMKSTIIYDMKKYYPKAWKRWKKFKQEHIRKPILANLHKGIAEGDYREDINPEIMATYRVAQVQMGFDNETFSSDAYDFIQVQLQVFEHFVYGIVTEKGKKLYLKYQKKQ